MAVSFKIVPAITAELPNPLNRSSVPALSGVSTIADSMNNVRVRAAQEAVQCRY